MKKIYMFIIVSTISCFQLQAQCTGFSDGFESGTYLPTWQVGTGTYTRTVTTTLPAVGTYCFEQACAVSNSFYQGTYTTFTPFQPGYISWYAKTNTTTAANGYMVSGDANIAADNGIIFSYFNATSGLRFYGTTGYNHPITANTWYHIEAKNIDYVARNSDIYVNGVLILTDWPFRSATATTFDRIHLFSLSASTVNYDAFIYGYQAPIINSSNVTNIDCFGNINGSIDLTVTAGPINGYLLYSWSNLATTQDISGLAGGNYIVTITDSVGCTAVDTFMVYEPMPISSSGIVTNNNCNGDSTGAIDLNVSGGTPGSGYTYLWNAGSTTEDLSNIPAGNYIVDITDSSGCVFADTFLVNQPTTIISSAIITDNNCNGDSTGAIDLSASGGTPGSGYSYSWSDGNSTQDLANVPAGNYIVNITDSMGCTSADTFDIIEPSLINLVSFGTDLDCNADGSGSIDLTVSGGSPGYTYNWDNAATTQDISGLDAGTYIVTVTDSMGCIQMDTVSLTEPSPITSSAVTTSDNGTNNGTIDLTVSGGTPGYGFAWSNSAITEDLSGLAAGNYIVTITDNNGCTGVDTVVVFSTASIGGDPTILMNIWPNPFTNVINLQFMQVLGLSTTLSISDINGKVIANYTINPGTSAQQISLSENIPSGIYFLSLHQGEKTYVVKMVKE